MAKKYIDAEKLKAETERLWDEYDGKELSERNEGAIEAIDKIESFIDSLQQEQQELPEKEITEYYYHKGVYEGLSQGRADALKMLDEFAKVKANPVIAIRQQKQPSEELEAAAEISFDEAQALTEDYRDFLAKGLTENKPRPIGPHWFCEYAKKRFIAGAEWQKEQMMTNEEMKCALRMEYEKGVFDTKQQMLKDAVEADVNTYTDLASGKSWAEFVAEMPTNNLGDKVKIVIVKED